MFLCLRHGNTPGVGPLLGSLARTACCHGASHNVLCLVTLVVKMVAGVVTTGVLGQHHQQLLGIHAPALLLQLAAAHHPCTSTAAACSSLHAAGC